LGGGKNRGVAQAVVGNRSMNFTNKKGDKRLLRLGRGEEGEVGWAGDGGAGAGGPIIGRQGKSSEERKKRLEKIAQGFLSTGQDGKGSSNSPKNWDHAPTNVDVVEQRAPESLTTLANGNNKGGGGAPAQNQFTPKFPLFWLLGPRE